MNRRMMIRLATVLAAGVAAAATAQQAAALATLFTYQGQLQQDGSPVNGSCDFQFSLWDAAGSGSQVGSTVPAGSVNVVDGLFTAALDFGASAFMGDNRWLQIAVRCPAGSGIYTTLASRQLLTGTPYALYAPAAGSAGDLSCNGCVGTSDLAPGAVTSGKIAAGTIDVNNLAFTPGTVTAISTGPGLTGGTITASGTISAVFGTTSGTVAAGDHNHDNAYWKLGGNNGTSPGAQFVGTADNQALELRVNGQRALRIEPASSPNVVGGYNANTATSGVLGATICGGGSSGSANRVTDHYGTVSGGQDNQAGDAAGAVSDANFATVGGGAGNTAAGWGDTVGGGAVNQSSGFFSVIAGGYDNLATSVYAVIGGGKSNRAQAAYATIAGGGRSSPNDAATGNRVLDDYGTVGGGGNNQAGDSGGVTSDATYATVAGGGGNIASGVGSAIGGGGGNQATADYATVPGGAFNIASAAGSFAAGRGAWALHDGSFVWGDGTAPAVSQGVNTFNALATGGFRFYFDNVGHHCDLTSTAGWQCSFPSDRNLKTDLVAVDTRAVLARVAVLPMHTWTYKSQAPSVRHLGPMAQDFHAAFNVGENETQISTVDANGVALAAIQGLYQIVQEKDAALAAVRKQQAMLEARLAALEQLMVRAGLNVQQAMAGGGGAQGGAPLSQ